MPVHIEDEIVACLKISHAKFVNFNVLVQKNSGLHYIAVVMYKMPGGYVCFHHVLQQLLPLFYSTAK